MLRIAVCDDEREVMETVCQMTEDYEFKKKTSVLGFTDGFEFLNDIISNKDNEGYDIVILDMNLEGQPVSDGVSISKVVRKYCPSVKIIFMSWYIDSSRFEPNAMPFGWMEKPIERETLYKLLEKAND